MYNVHCRFIFKLQLRPYYIELVCLNVVLLFIPCGIQLQGFWLQYILNSIQCFDLFKELAFGCEDLALLENGSDGPCKLCFVDGMSVDWTYSGPRAFPHAVFKAPKKTNIKRLGDVGCMRWEEVEEYLLVSICRILTPPHQCVQA